MNRLCYRIIFNRARGMLMVVADIARSHAGRSPACATGHAHSRLISKVSAISFGLWLATGVIQTARGAITADKTAPGNRQPTILGTANGTPQVNIQTPSAGGVSRNTYSRFDVDSKGVILNNARKNTSTQLAGMVAANPWLAKGEARIILNEVNARDPSRLNGYIEVAGRKAQVVIANPSGITCDGCGFINAGRATLTTGAPQLQNGSLAGYQVERGEIVINGKGLDTTRQDHTDIIARAVKVNAALHANDLRVTTGRNRVDAAHEQVSVSADGGAPPPFALDVARVGGMYAGKIRLRGTEKGVGIRNAGHIGAAAGEVTLSADGIIGNSGAITAAGNLALASRSGVNNSGALWSSADAGITTAGHVQNSGSVAASRHTRVKAGSVTSTATGTLAAGVTAAGKTGSHGDLTLGAAGKLAMHGMNVAAGAIGASGQGLDASGSRTQAKNITLNAGQQSLSTAGAQIIADGTLSARAAATHNNNGGLLAADTLSLAARQLKNNQGQIVQSGAQALTLHHQDGIENREGTIAANARDLTLQTTRLDNHGGEIIHAGSGALNIASGAFTGGQGSLTSSGALALTGRELVLDGAATTAQSIRIKADSLSNRGGQLIQSGSGTMALDVRQTTDNRGGQIAANGDVKLNTARLDNRQGKILAADAGSLTLAATGQADSREGVLAAAGNVAVTAGQLDNARGLISAEKGQAQLSSTGQLGNAGGQIAAGGSLDIAAAGLDTRQGVMSGDNVALSLKTAALNNQSGIIAAQRSLTVRSGELNNDGGRLQSGQAMAIDTHGQALTSRNSGEKGGIYAQTALTLNSGGLDNSRGVILAGGDARLTTTNLNNQDGSLASGQALRLSAQGDVNNDRGLMQASGLLDIHTHGHALSNRENLQSGGIVAGSSLALNAAGVDNTQGLMLSEGDLALNSAALLNREGTLAAAADMTLAARGLLDNTAGLLQAARRLSADTHGGALINTDTLDSGGIVAGSALSLTVGRFDNQAGAVATDGALELQAGPLNNRAGVITAGDALSASVSGPLINDAGLIQAGQDMRIDTHGNTLSNRQTTESGGIVTAASLQINSGALDNLGGQIAAGQTLALSAQGAVSNDRGLMQAGHDMRIDTHGDALSNRETKDSGGIISFGRLDVAAGELINQSGMLASQAALSLVAQTMDNRRGETGAALDLALTLSGALNNQDGVVSAGEELALTTPQLDNAAGVVVAGKDATLTTGQTDNRQGQIAAQGRLRLTGQRLNNDDGGLVQSASDITLALGDISNRNSGERGGITSQGDMRITAATLLSDRGLLLAGKQAVLDTGRFSNISGTLVALDALKLTTRSDTDNRAGLIQGKGVTLDTSGWQLDNQEGTLYSQAAMQLATAGLNNQAGTLAAKGDFTLKADWLDNRSGGRAVGEQATTFTLGRLDNHSGQIQSVGNLQVTAVQGVVDNTQGLIRSGATVTLNADTLLNRDTLAYENGIEGQNVEVNSRTLDNAGGSLLAGKNLTVSHTDTLDNTRGELAAGGALTLTGAALNLINTAGVVKAGELVTIQADRIGGDGQVLSRGDMALTSRQDILNTGEMIASGNLTLTTPGAVSNSGKLLAGAKLDLTAANLYNSAAAEIAAGHTWLTVANTLTNHGLIDGNRTLLKAGTLNNIGTGRIYGDYAAIQAGTLNNLAENGTAATIAGRGRVDIGAHTLNNRDHALIYSAGDMAVGGRLDANGLATGRAETLSNHSATLESAGNMSLSVAQLNNINDRFATDVVQVSSEPVHEYQLNGAPDRWRAGADGVFVDNNSSDGLLNLNTPAYSSDNFYEYQYTRTTEEEVITESDPGNILAGGHLAIHADRVLNDKSRIVAGGTLGIEAERVDNLMPQGQRRITDEGVVTHYYRKKNKGSDSQRAVTTDYAPPTVIQSITLRPGRLEGNAAVNGSGLQLASAAQQGTDAAISHTGALASASGGRDIRPDAPQAAGAKPPDLSAGMPAPDIASPALPGVSLPARQPVAPGPGQQTEIPLPAAPGSDAGRQTVVRITGPNTQLPDNSLFKTHPAPQAAYLVETDPRFTQNKQWLGSDYMQNAFAINHDNMHKRLGDGYYEQRLVREQIIALTGGRYLGDHRSDEAQFKALMDEGIRFGKQYNLIPGVALTPEQMALLTGDMVWLVNTPVQLADGTWQTVMVPQVYARVQPGDTDGSGALLGGRNVVMNLNRDLVNSGAVSGREAVALSADNITNRAGTIQGADVSLQARADISNIGGIISGSNRVLANAGRDIHVVTPTRSAQRTAGNNHFERTTAERTGGIYVQGDNGKLILSAGRDISLAGAQVVNRADNGQTVLNAGRDLNLTAVITAASDSLAWDKNNWLKQSATAHVGSEISGAGSVSLVAGRDVNTQAATVTAGSSLGVGAGRDINLTAATDSSEFESKHKYTGSNGAFSKTTTITHDRVNRETARGSLFSADSVKMQAGNNLLVQGSHVVADNDVRLQAGNNLTLTTAQARSAESHQKQEKKSGLSGTGGIGMTYGSQSLKVTDTAQEVAHQGSTVGSVKGNVTLRAGNDLTVNSADLIAGSDMTLVGKNVSITSATQTSKQTHEVEQKSSGFTLALSGTAGSFVNSAAQSARQAKETDNDRLAALQGVKAALTGVQASQAARMDAARGDQASNTNTVGVTLSWGSQSSKSTQTSEQTTSKGSSLSAGNNLAVIATGSAQKGRDGDILIQGSQVSAGNDVLLSANRDVNLVSAENTSTLEGKNESKGGSLGVGIGAGSGGWGINVSASVNAGRGHEKGNGTTHTETTVEAGNNLTLISGRDTNLTGAQVSGERVTAVIGRDLTLRSEQDTDSYHSKQQNVSAGASFSFGSMSGSASVNASRDKMDSHFKSVNEQSGITAGSGGYDIQVGGHTQLDGAVIASAAKDDKNRLETGTLGWRDIHNEAEYKVEHQSVGMSTGGSAGGQFAGNMANSMLSGMNSSGHAESTTSSAISGGSIIIRDKANQQQSIDDLSRDTANASGRIDAIFDKEKEQQRLEEAQLISDIGTQVSDIARTEDAITAAQKASEKRQSATQEEHEAAKAEWEQAHPGKTATEADIGEVIYQNAYADAMTNAASGTGSRNQQAIQAVTAAVQGLAGGDMSAAIAGAAAPYVAEVIGHHAGLAGMGKAAAHAVANAVLASLQGQSALAGAAGAVSGELAGIIALEMYGKPVSALSEEEKQRISALATLASGIAGGLAGNSASSAVAGAQAGKTTVENNLLGGSEDAQAAWIRQHGVDMATCSDNPGGAACQKAMNERDAVGLALATGSVALLPGSAQAMWGLGAGANAGISYLADGTIDPANAAIAGWVNVISRGNGLGGTIGWNAAGGALGNWIDDKDPLTGAITNGVGAGIGYGIGKGISWGTNAGANWWKGGWDPKFNPVLQKYAEIKGDFGISKEVTPSNIPGSFGDIGASFSSEYGGKKLEPIIEEKLK
ncbi:hemagglutinin repeat-containing protein [Enterobacteriaceae bacterium YMB-R22]|uniref:hemagglutinin repeat-containing protein n=1 Tax=Tenebrionicola larvae TaxID=2815733 RepID=UPI002012D5B2|nr:hemagglutinin repeat-containing protein [Tenebrionicola larvae]MBV4412616.1 hemagglutinin repeat-containing protein [Tenebrionicola larvae]